ncbi:MAG: HD domain-containing protein [Candidatus Hydrogenedens sp.]
MKVKKKKYKEILSYYPEENWDLIAHCKQVKKLAIQLFEKTYSLHKLGKKEKKYLWYASLLHDIGYIVNGYSHNKHSCKFILNSPLLSCAKKKRKIIACIARYHRGPSPKESHKIFGKLNKEKKRIVLILSALLRIADGLDYTHQNSVKSLNVKIEKDKVTIEIITDKDIVPQIDMNRAKKKSNLLATVFHLQEITFCLKD